MIVTDQNARDVWKRLEQIKSSDLEWTIQTGRDKRLVGMCETILQRREEA